MEKITIELESRFVEEIFNVACEAGQSYEYLIRLAHDKSDKYSDRELEAIEEMYIKDIRLCKKISDFFVNLM